jgi:UDP-3-O-[3-hydroxymyristoyl] glucosamine N-acyltransferase
MGGAGASGIGGQMRIGDKVKVSYTDAVGNKVLWDGVLKTAFPDGRWQVDLGGIAIAFEPEKIEVQNG